MRGAPLAARPSERSERLEQIVRVHLQVGTSYLPLPVNDSALLRIGRFSSSSFPFNLAPLSRCHLSEPSPKDCSILTYSRASLLQPLTRSCSKLSHDLIL